MEEIRNLRKLKIFSSFSIFLLLCMTVSDVNMQEENPCPAEDYLTEEGICCNKCHQGFKLVEECHAAGQRSKCTLCPDGEYMDGMNALPNCRRCRKCKEKDNKLELSPCTISQNTVCQCKSGYYESRIDSYTFQCLPCKTCKDGEIELQKCTENQNTKCEPRENYC